MRPSADFGAIADRVAKKSECLAEVLAGLRSDKAKIKYGCLKILRMISEKQPALLYPEFDQFVRLLGGDNTILKWGAIVILGNLAAVDSGNKIDRILEQYLRPIAGPVMITAANTIGGAGEIAHAKPYLADRICRALLAVETAQYKTPECRNVALGHVVKSLALFFEHVRDSQPVITFVERQLHNPRMAVTRKAAAFLKKHKPATQAPSRSKSRSR